jgi:hypothetical protein
MKRLIALLVVPGTMGVLAQPALARPPAGSAETCTAAYEALTLPQLLEQARRNGIAEEDARRLFESVNNNEDDWICSKDQPSPLENHYNFIDNQAIGHASG